VSEWKLCTAFCVLLYKVKSAKSDSNFAAVELWCRGWRPRQPDIEAVKLEFVTNEKKLTMSCQTLCGYHKCEIKTALHNVYRAAAFFSIFLFHRTNIFAVFGYPFIYTIYLRLNKARCSCNKHSCTCFVKLAAVLV